MRTMLATLTLLLSVALIGGCAPEVGSEKWCEKMNDKPKGEWTANEAKDFAKHCVLGNYTDKDE
ncbi:MAG: DUF3012 domain-containing protein [Gammaproteobacteria bacterium]|nr:DUF3012 domain-containing protein [Gammaproteobacteria bacterium]MDH3434127.1 DUF3012 domain-containing protein [Gammaproteobacteria bacterium]